MCNAPQPWQGIRLDSNREASILSGLDARRRLRILSTLVDCVEHPGAREAASKQLRGARRELSRENLLSLWLRWESRLGGCVTCYSIYYIYTV